MRTLFRLLLRLYPREHQDVFAGEMLGVLSCSAEDARAHGPFAYAGFIARESLALLNGAFRERIGDNDLAVPAISMAGGVALTGIFQSLFYRGMWRTSHLASAAVHRAHIPQDQSVEGLIAAIFAVVALVCLLPVFFLLSIHLRRGRR